MTDSLQITDDQSKAVQVAPRISKAYIESQISRTLFYRGMVIDGLAYFGAPMQAETVDPLHRPTDLDHHTFCVITTKSGFTVLGHSAPAEPANFDADLGRQFAYENAFRQLWPLFAFALLQEQTGVVVAADPLNQPEVR